MDPVVLQGAMRSTDIAAFKKPVYMDDNILFKDTSAYRFVALLERLRGSKGVSNRTYEFMQMGLQPNVMTVLTAAAAGATTIAVDHPEYAHRDNRLVSSSTFETFMMNEDIGGRTAEGKITVMGKGGSGGIAAAIAADTKILVLPEAHAEGEAVPDGYSIKPEHLFTKIQQSDMSTGKYTDIAGLVAEYGEKQLSINRAQKWIEWKMKKELALLLGAESDETTSASGAQRVSMKGLYDWPIKKITVPQGVLDMAVFNEIMCQITEIGASGRPIAFLGNNAWNQVQNFPANSIQRTQSEKVFGWTIDMLRTGYGDLPIERCKVLNSKNGLAGCMFIVDIDKLQLLHLEGNGMSLRDRIYMDVTEARDIHNVEDVISGSFGLKVEHAEDCHAWVSGIK